ncbi:set domain protein [Nannochloropsis oceanica]
MVTLRSGIQATDAEEVAALVHATDALVPCLEVKPSFIPGAGDGLFTAVDLPALKPLVLYYGELRKEKAQGRYCIQVGPSLTLDAEALLSFSSGYEGGATALASGAGRGDETKTQNLGRYVNDARGQARLENNMRYGRLLRFDHYDEKANSVLKGKGNDAAQCQRRIRSKRPPCVVMYSTRNIKAGEELLASYGKWYWQRWGDMREPPDGVMENREE